LGHNCDDIPTTHGNVPGFHVTDTRILGGCYGQDERKEKQLQRDTCSCEFAFPLNNTSYAIIAVIFGDKSPLHK
jgi:hypothetical protein